MAKILIVYDSRSGNTEKVAQAIAAGAKQVENVEVKIKKVDETSLADMRRADAILMGSPTYYGVMSAKLKELIDRSVKIHGKLEGKIGAAFTTSGGTATGAESTLLSILQAMLVHGMIIQGRSDDKHYGMAVVGSPKTSDVNKCRTFGHRVACLVVRLKTPLRKNRGLEEC